jgi:aminoglycoside phosphotransferase (APT) family kinase protein
MPGRVIQPTGNEPTGQFDAAPLEAWMEQHVEGFEGPIEVEKFPGGQSNPTFKLTSPGRQYVLRRKPPGKLLKGAHAVEREYRIMTALGPLGFPVPRTYGLCEDSEVLGTPFFVMDMVDGRIFWDPRLPEVPTDERRACYESMCETIARLHRIDYEAAGLGNYGKPGNFVERQITIWSRQYLQDEAAGRIAAMDRLVEWLPRNIPDDDKPGALPPWTAWSSGCRATSPTTTARPASSTGIFAATTSSSIRPSRVSSPCWTGNCPRSGTRWPTLPIT